MSLVPYFFEDPFRRHHSLSHIVEPDELHEWPMLLPSRSLEQFGDLRHQLVQFEHGATTMINDKEHFQANIDVQQFRPNEISVRLMGDHSVKVEARHEEQQDDHGFISRHFVRRYLLPKDCDMSKVTSKLTHDGILIISAPKKEEGELDGTEIPILHSRRPLFRRPHLWPSHHTPERKRKLSLSN